MIGNVTAHSHGELCRSRRVCISIYVCVLLSDSLLLLTRATKTESCFSFSLSRSRLLSLSFSPIAICRAFGFSVGKIIFSCHPQGLCLQQTFAEGGLDLGVRQSRWRGVWEGGSEQWRAAAAAAGGCDSQGARRCMLGQVGARWEYGNPFSIGFAGNLWESFGRLLVSSVSLELD